MPVTKLGISFPSDLVEEIDRLSKGMKRVAVRLSGTQYQK